MKKLVLFFALFLSMECMAREACFASVEKAGTGVFEILYRGEASKVEVTIRSAAGNVLLHETVKEGNFVRPYNLQELAAGRYLVSLKSANSHYYFEVEKEEGKIEVVRTLSISLQKEDDDRYTLEVKGELEEPVFVHFRSKEHKMLFSEEIRESSSFEKSYRIERNVDLGLITASCESLFVAKELH